MSEQATETARAEQVRTPLHKSAEYQTWLHIKNRCSNRKSKSWHNYGGRGITISDAWRDDFAAFLDHVGPRPSPKHSIDRIDNNGNYEPGNVRWATRSQQNRNTRVVRLLTFRGESRCMSEWAEVLGLALNTIAYRLNTLGWDVDRALGTPPQRPQANLPSHKA